MAVNASEVAEPAKTLLLRYSCFRNQATEFCSSHCSWPVGTEAAAGGVRQQLHCYKMSASPRPAESEFRGMPVRRPSAVPQHSSPTLVSADTLPKEARPRTFGHRGYADPEGPAHANGFRQTRGALSRRFSADEGYLMSPDSMFFEP